MNTNVLRAADDGGEFIGVVLIDVGVGINEGWSSCFSFRLGTEFSVMRGRRDGFPKFTNEVQHQVRVLARE